MTHIQEIQVNDGSHFPSIAFGTVNVKGAHGLNDVLTAIEAGYRLIDTSTNYNNEGMVGEAIRRSSVPREELMISSKLPGAAHSYDKAIQMIQESLYRIGIDHFDKYLIHWPLPKREKYDEAWQALVDAQKFGLIKTIGVSNFLPEHLDRIIEKTGVTPATNQIERHTYFNNNELVEENKKRGILKETCSTLGRETNDIYENKTIKKIVLSIFLPEHLYRIIEKTGVTTATNQIERHPYFNNNELVEENKKRGILTESWSPLGREINDVLENKTIKNIAEKHDKSPAQVIARWNLQNVCLHVVKA